jgi:hypothetical protein
MFAGRRIERFSDRLRVISRLAAEQDSLLDNQNDPARQPPSAVPGLTKGHVFFRFSSRQCMLLIITLSVCFAVNRNNRIADFLFLISLIINEYSIYLIYSVIVALAIGKMARPGYEPSPSSRLTKDGRDSGCSSGSRADVFSVRLRSISGLVREQRHARGATVQGNSTRPGGADS